MPLTYYIKFLRSLKNQMLQSTPTRILPVLIVTQNLKKKKKKKINLFVGKSSIFKKVNLEYPLVILDTNVQCPNMHI